MKRFVFYLIFFLTFLFVSADAKLPKLKAKEVILVGKINVHVSQEELEFYAKSWGVTDLSASDSYVIYNYGYKNYIIGTVLNQPLRIYNEDYYVCSKDDYFLSKRKVQDKTKLTAESPIKWHFFGSDDFYINLPFSFEAEIPEGKKFVYVGDFDYYLDGSDFHITKVVVSDSYESAASFLKDYFGQSVDLYKAVIKPL